MAGFAAGLLLCGVTTGADYGSTLRFQEAARTRGFEINEVGPIARHGLGAGAAVKGGLCVVGELLLKGHPRERKVMRVIGVVATGVIVGSHLIQQRNLERGQ